MNTRHNLVVGIVGTVWTALVGFIAVPIYVHYLGVSSYGLIGFFAATQALLQLLDLGLAPTINREIALHAASGTMAEGRRLLRTLAVVYCSTAILIGMFVCAGAPLIVHYWLQAGVIDQATLVRSVMLMGLVIACRWPVALYQGALMGMQRLVVSSSVTAASATVSSLGAIAVLALVSPTIEAFFLWQATAAFLQVVAMRRAAWKVVGWDQSQAWFDASLLKKIWRFSAGMSGIAFASVVLLQLDKVLLSRMVSLADFGKYALAGVVASALYVLLTPTFNVVYPKMATLVALGDEEGLAVLYKIGTRLLCSVLLPIALSIALYSLDVVEVWTRNPALAESVAPMASLLVLGTACNGVMHFPYALQLAYGRTRLALSITIVLAVLLAPLIVFLTVRYGSVGSAGAWLVVNLSYVFLGTWLTHRTILRGLGTRWLAIDVGLPLLMSSLVTYAGWRLFRFEDHPITSLCIASAFGLLAIGINGLMLPKDVIAVLRRRPGDTVAP